MIKYLLAILTSLFLLVQDSYEQGFDYSLYTEILAVSPKPITNRCIDGNQLSKLDSIIFFKSFLSKELIAFISDSMAISMYNKEPFFVGYFINNSNDTLSIDRCDGAILNTETEIFVDNKWVTFQLNLPSDCGNSYFKTKLPPKSYHVLEIPDPSNGDIPTKLRVKITYKNVDIYTNAVVIKLTQERIEKTKQPIKPIPWSH